MKKHSLTVVLLLCVHAAFSQAQVCPLNSYWSSGDLTHWEAYTGNNQQGNGLSAIKEKYDSGTTGQFGTKGNNIIYEYQLSGVPAIQVLDSSNTDVYGGFATVPTINGYQYTNALKLGSTAIRSNSQGGYIRGVSYRFAVPPGPATEPYTMTYAYAMVMSNGSHNTDQQPLFSSTIMGGDSVITCASASYFLPTFNNSDNMGVGATLNKQLAAQEGFFLSPQSPAATGNPAAEEGTVWCKNWSEVTFDLAAYRGQQVTLTFETDNCVPGGHFAYSYIALRSTCAGLLISGDTVACTNSTLTFSVPALMGATYQWTVPADWSVVSNDTGSNLKVKVGSDGGTLFAQEQNGCTNLRGTLSLKTTPPTVAGTIGGAMEICAGTNAVDLTLNASQGNILGWQATTDGSTWTSLGDTSSVYIARNLTVTTEYRVRVQNGAACIIETAPVTTIPVDPVSVGGKLGPSDLQLCSGQTKDADLILTGQTGTPVNWQSSTDANAIGWSYFEPPDTATEYGPGALTTPTQYRVIVQSGVCPADTSTVATVNYTNLPFPQATIDPADTLICYGAKAALSATVSLGTNYTWTNASTLTDKGNGRIGVLPYMIESSAAPKSSTEYVLTIINAGCPAALLDTFLVRVRPEIIVNAGNDTAVVVGEPLQLHAVSNDTTTSGGDAFAWTPVTGMDNAAIADPVVTVNTGMDNIRYFVTATAADGCTGVASILVTVFKTGPDFFVPNAFTPGGATNNIFRPVPVGISSLSFFRVYNRLGQLMYVTTAIGQGWDGRIADSLAEGGTYVWMVQGTTYNGHIVFHKGTMILIR
jgi:hypothetical protein